MEVVHSNLAHTLHRGDSPMIVKEMRVGQTRVMISNEGFCAPEDREKVDRDIAMAAWAIIDELIERGEEV